MRRKGCGCAGNTKWDEQGKPAEQKVVRLETKFVTGS